MDKRDVSRSLKEMSDLLEIQEANTFEIMAFRNASRSLDAWEGDLEEAVDRETLQEISGIGKGIAAVITSFVREGNAEEYQKIRAQCPPGLPDLLSLSGIGPKKVKALWHGLDIDSLDALEKAAQEGRVRELKGFSANTEEKILQGIERRRQRSKKGFKFAPTRKSTLGDEKARDLRPKATGALRCGTSGYAYKEWKGSFYPQELAATEFLPFYAEQFPTVEINNTFYRFPSENALTQWAKQAPEGFLFAVKANQRVTHRDRLRNTSDTVERFFERCRLLGPKIGPILFQLPPTLKEDGPLLEDFVKSLPKDGRFAMEFRHPSWFGDATLSTLKEHHVALVVHDDEKDPAPREVTSDFTYVRLRRDEYDEATLDTWHSWFTEIREQGQDLFIYLKHDEGGTSPLDVLKRWAPSAAPKRHVATPVRKKAATRKKRGA